MGAPKGNKYYQLRSTHGAARKFNTPEELSEAATAYFTARSKRKMNGKPLPFTIISMCQHIGITNQIWSIWKRDRKDLFGIIDEIEETIREQKFVGAMVGSYSPAFVARDLGMADRTKTELTGKDEGPVEVKTTPSEKIKEALEQIAKRSRADSEPSPES